MPRDEAHLLDILIFARRAVEASRKTDLRTLETDWSVQAVVLHELLLLGEAVKRLSDEFRSMHPEIPWNDFAGLRDVIVHQYDRIQYEKIWESVGGDLPLLIAFLESIVPEEPEG